METLDAKQSLRLGLELDSLVKEKPPHGDARVDMTAMIDLVFMMNIFFLVTTLVAGLAEVDLPAARHVVAADLDESVVLTVTAAQGGGRPSVYLGNGTGGDPLPETNQEERITAAVEAELRQGKNAVVIKAEKLVPLRDIARIAAASTTIEGTKLNLAVMEKD